MKNNESSEMFRNVPFSKGNFKLNNCLANMHPKGSVFISFGANKGRAGRGGC